MLKVGGIWVSPAEVEHLLLEHPAVEACAVTGREDRDGLVKPVPTSSCAAAPWLAMISRRSCGSSRASGSPSTTSALD